MHEIQYLFYKYINIKLIKNGSFTNSYFKNLVNLITSIYQCSAYGHNSTKIFEIHGK